MVHRLVALAAVVLVATLALCLLETAGDGDLCGVWAMPSLGLAMGPMATLVGRLLPEVQEIYRPCPSERLEPPPRA